MFPVLLRDKFVPGLELAILAAILVVLTLAWGWQIVRLLRRRRQLRATTLPPPADALAAVLGKDDQPSSADTLGFGTVAQAVAGLLRNAATGAPYSVVVSGNWGSGKSSVMLQIRKELCQNPDRTAFRDIWINVWHYQSGQHLLGAFLRELLRVCNDGPYRRSFHSRRLRELSFWQAWRAGIIVFLLGPVLLYLLGVLLESPPLHLNLTTPVRALDQWFADHQVGWMLAPFHLLSQAPALLSLAGSDKPTSSSSSLTIWSTVLAWLGTLLGLLHTLRTHGAAITELLPLRQFEQAAARADTGFRDQYRREFSDVLRYAPSGLRIVFFVDDVDRIPGPRVLELLESLNFLVEVSREARAQQDAAVLAAADDQRTKSAPEDVARLYFVLGMHVPEVVRILADALDSDKRMPSVEARHHAARYLEKLIDLVVPMPTLAQCKPEQVARLLFGEEQPTPAQERTAKPVAAPLPT
ncbi:P-loop NTPase fold protein [uncultured Hymenobacter sp.]|uniref:P-loop NTPase fold protein n=1 Tax=uncultured Hymenobacter sp. TaxID=170016 RepID=UPI0035CAC032